MNYLILIIFNYSLNMLTKIFHFFLKAFSQQKEFILRYQKEYICSLFLIIYEATIIFIIPSFLLTINQILKVGIFEIKIDINYLAFTSIQFFICRVIIWPIQKFKGYMKLLLLVSLSSFNTSLQFIIFMLEILIIVIQKKIKLSILLPILFLMNVMIYSSRFFYYLNQTDYYIYSITAFVSVILPCINFKFKLAPSKTIQFLKSSLINITEKITQDNSKALMASIVHDLRNPVSAVHSIISVLSNSNNITSEQREQLESALFSCDFQLTIINNILDMNKIQANKFQMLQTEFYLANSIQMILKMQSNVAKKKLLNFQSNILNTLPEIVVGDKNRIGQILLNIIGNSIKFTSEGEIIVTLKWEKDWSNIEFTNDSMRQSIKGASESGEINSLYINELISDHNSTNKKGHKSNHSYGEKQLNEMSVLQKMNHYFPLKKLNVNFGMCNSRSTLINYEENHRNNEGCIRKELLTEVSNSRRISLSLKGLLPIRIDLSKIKSLESEEGSGVLLVEISDTGEGIKEEEQGKLFQPYSQAKSNISVPGTGLGLWISKQLTELMGGKIKLFSVFEKGTCIRIALPLTISSIAGIVRSNNNSENFRSLQESSPKAPRHLTDSLKSKFEVIILYDHVFLNKQIQKINSNLQQMNVNLDFRCFEFNQSFNIKDFQNDSLIIIICSFNCNKALDIVRDIKKLTIENAHNNYSFSVFNRNFKSDNCEGLEYFLQGYVDYCKEFSIQKVEDTILNYAKIKAKYE